MFASLGPNRFVGSNAEQSHIDAKGTDEHIGNELLVSGHVHDRDAAYLGKIDVGKADVDGHSPGFFLGEPICVDAGQRLNQGSLAMIDMARGADQFRHVVRLPCHANVLAKRLVPNRRNDRRR